MHVNNAALQELAASICLSTGLRPERLALAPLVNAVGVEGKPFSQLCREANDPSSELAQRVLSQQRTGDTFFFRHPEQFDFLNVVVFSRLARQRPSFLRFWSAGCSTGEETFSLASAAMAYFGAASSDRGSKRRVTLSTELSVLGTDVLQSRLNVGREGRYEGASADSVPHDLTSELFEKDAAELGMSFEPILEEGVGSAAWNAATYVPGVGVRRGPRWIRSDLRRVVQFEQHNLAARQPARFHRSFHLILCRNVLVYLEPAAAARAVAQLASALRPGGFLVFAPGEKVEPPVGLEPVGPPDFATYRLPE